MSPWNHPDFMNVIDDVIDTCTLPNKDGYPTPFKVSPPTPYAHEFGYRINKQKSIVIYPLALESELNLKPAINFAETIRISDILGSHLEEIPGYDELEVDSDIRLPSGVWVNFGGMQYYQEGEDPHDQSFWDRMQVLRMPGGEKRMVLTLLESQGIKPPGGNENIPA